MSQSAAFIVIDDESVSWVKSVFGNCNPWLLKFGKTNILDYYVDFLLDAGFEKIRVVSSVVIKDIEAHFAQSDADISFFMVDKEASIYDIIAKNSDYLKDSDALAIISGFYKFVCQSDNLYNVFKRVESFIIQKENVGFMFFKKNGNSFEHIMHNFDFREISGESKFNIRPIDSAKEYLSVCMELNGQLFENALDVRTDGSKFFFEHLVAISDLKGDAVLGDPTIKKSLISSGSFISKNTQIVDSVLCENSYIPEGMKIENSVVAGTRIVDVNEGIARNIFFQPKKSDFLAFSKSPIRVKIIEMWYNVCSLFFLVFLLVPHAIFTATPLKKNILGRKQNIYTNFGVKKIFVAKCSKQNIASRIFFMLSLDIFQLFKFVLTKDISLIGQGVVVSESSQLENGLQKNGYSPGVFPNGLHGANSPNYHKYIKSDCSFLKAFSLPFIFYFRRVKFFAFL